MEEPVAFNYCIELYELMRKTATPETVGNVVVDVWEGTLTRLVMDERPNGLGLSNPYYSKIMNILKSTDCVQQIRRGGGGGSTSKWAMIRPPTLELLNQYAAQGVIQGNKRKSITMAAEQQLRDMNDRINQLEDRIALLEGTIKSMKKEGIDA